MDRKKLYKYLIEDRGLFIIIYAIAVFSLIVLSMYAILYSSCN